MAIIVVSPGRKAQRLEQQGVGREDYLQQYIQANPETLPVEELKPGAKLLVIAREFPTESGPIDALAIDDDGDIYIVETKLAKNPDKRRVIAQMLDYGAALWSAGAESFVATAAARGGDLREKIADAFALTEEAEVTSVLSSIRANLAAGQFQFVVLMNQLDDRLRNLITFVNSNSRFRVLGLELDFYRHGELDILIPRLYGAEARSLATADSGARVRKWTESCFFEEVSEQLDPAGATCVRELYDWALRNGEIRFSSGDVAAFNVAFPELTKSRVFKLLSDGTVILLLSGLGALEAALRGELRTAGFAIPDDVKKPKLPLSEWSGRLQQ